MPAKPKHDWEMVRKAWLERNLDRETSAHYSLRRCAKDHGISYGVLRNRATKEDWRGQLASAARKLTDAAIARTREAAAIDEAEIRVRQVTLARLAGSLAEDGLRMLHELGGVNGDMLLLVMEPKDIIKLAQMSMEQERKAAGLPEKMEHNLPGITEESGAESPAMAAMRQKLRNKEMDELRAHFRKEFGLGEMEDAGSD